MATGSASGGRTRHPLDGLPFMEVPEKPAGGQRSLERWRSRREAVQRTNDVLAGMRQFWAGELNDSLINRNFRWVGESGSRVARQLTADLFERIAVRVPPVARPVGEAALRRLRRPGSSGSPVSLGAHLPDGRGQKQDRAAGSPGGLGVGHHCYRIPERGEIWPATVNDIAVPALGSRLIPISTVSPRVTKFLDSFKTLMLEDSVTLEKKRAAFLAEGGGPRRMWTPACGGRRWWPWR